MNTTLVIHHSADHDGLACRAVAHKALGATASYLGWDYGDDIPDLAPYDKVYVLDISFPPAVMSANAEKLVWCDHHRSALKECPSYLAGIRIDGVAAVRLTFQWFFGDRKATLADYIDAKVKEPRAIQLLGQFDIWDKRDPQTDQFQYGLSSEETPQWDLITDGENPAHAAYVTDIAAKGQTILRYLAVTNAQIANKSGFDVKWEGLTLRALNTAAKGSMQFDASIKDHHDGMLKFNWDGENWDCSLYGVKHKPDVDLSVIAKKHGGGGHRSACGMRLKTLPKELGGV